MFCTGQQEPLAGEPRDAAPVPRCSPSYPRSTAKHRGVFRGNGKANQLGLISVFRGNGNDK